MQLHELTPATKRGVAKRIGRGGKRGKTSGRGGKGQTARAGNSTRPELRDMIKKLPKLRGHGKNRAKTVNDRVENIVVINLSRIDKSYENGETVSPSTLFAKGLIEAKGKQVPAVKILATGELSKKLTVENCQLSEAAKVKIEKAGGEVKK